MKDPKQQTAPRPASFALGLVLATLGIASAEERGKLVQVGQDFSTDPGWEGLTNRVECSDCPAITQDFGWSPTTPAATSPGEIGGVIWRSTTPAWYAMRFGHVLGFSNAEPFKTSDEANSNEWLRYMFVYGQGDTLHLGRALPREWLSGKESICLKRVHTRFGVVSVEYEPDPAQNRITCKADLALVTAPARTLVRFRHPEKKPIQSVRVNGVEHQQFDPVRGDVDVSGKSGALTIEALYAPPSPAQELKQSPNTK
jgi:hypothetical protein